MDCSLTTGYSGPKCSQDFRETSSWSCQLKLLWSAVTVSFSCMRHLRSMNLLRMLRPRNRRQQLNRKWLWAYLPKSELCLLVNAFTSGYNKIDIVRKSVIKFQRQSFIYKTIFICKLACDSYGDILRFLHSHLLIQSKAVCFQDIGKFNTADDNHFS